MAQIVYGGSIRPPGIFRILGSNGAGYVPLSSPNEIAVGDVVVGVNRVDTLASVSSSFESTISKAGQINQTSASNLSTVEVWVAVIPGT
jgi:hypothetical protein